MSIFNISAIFCCCCLEEGINTLEGVLWLEGGECQYESEGEIIVTTEEADFSLILNGVEEEFASYTYASNDELVLLVVVVLEVLDELLVVVVVIGDLLLSFVVTVEAAVVVVVVSVLLLVLYSNICILVYSYYIKIDSSLPGGYILW